ncbi:MAG: hypothetical protein ACYSWP_19725 [Planctomycetota bacterium]|jgi:hypothetical protein
MVRELCFKAHSIFWVCSALVVCLFISCKECDESKQNINSETQYGEAYAGLKCSIEPLKDSVKRGEDIKFILVLQNVSDKLIHLPKTRIEGESGLWMAMTGQKGERFLQVNIACPLEIYVTITDRTIITEIPPHEEIEIPLSYNGSLGQPTVRIWCGLVIDSDMVPKTYDGWTGSITSNVIEIDIVE